MREERTGEHHSLETDVHDTAALAEHSADGGERQLTESDVDRLLRIAAQEADGSYRVIASKALSGKPVGPFLYVGTADRMYSTIMNFITVTFGVSGRF